MSRIHRSLPRIATLLVSGVLMATGGCCTMRTPSVYLPVQDTMPRELSKVILPPYTIEPPDIITIDQVFLAPKEGYQLRPRDVVRITARRGPGDTLKEGDAIYVEVQGVPLRDRSFTLRPGDALEVNAAGVVPQPIAGRFQIDESGVIRLRVPEVSEVRDMQGNVVGTELVNVHDYGSVNVVGKSVEEAEQAIRDHLAERFPQVTVAAILLQEPTMPIQGTFVVHHRPDGEDEIIFSPPFGRVTVTRMTVAEAEKAIATRVEQSMYQVTVLAALANTTPVSGSYWVELDGSIDLDNPVQFARTAGEGLVAGIGAGVLYNVESGPLRRQGVIGPLLPPAVPEGAVPPQGGNPPSKTAFFGRIPDVRGKTLQEAELFVKQYLLAYFRDVEVTMLVEQLAAQQVVQGQHLVTMDGVVNLGTYGSVPVVGLTIEQAKMAIEHHLSQFFQNPEVSVDVFAYNSKVYYVITQGAGMGDAIYRFPVTGNETVLDAICQVGGLTGFSSERIWIARPTPQPGEMQILPVSWEAITAQASPATNYQILPGDRIFIAEDKVIAFDTGLQKVLAPVYSTYRFATATVGTVSRFSGNVLQQGALGNRFISGF